ncbi:glycosyltransferase family 4 protein [Candidatus Thiodictyon syntrophicum]|uniref:Glycosyltransferase WbuB n=1 Tax=Candidatus Thiodictyon syntrophicum TaxID=1166950 RepID=A0A2K8UE27_9GAMM|nr:glycosyltransferase family 4 protein [Candidatus Thiodictyon syntrophicum]AUB83848.1 glycosyltransferase WbuB [Candidatus Thiodictyon syntrophicum]
MHILFLTDNFPPEVNAPASRTFEHCREWVQAGHRVTVIANVPNFPRGKVFPGYRNRPWQRETMDGIQVVRVWTYIAANAGFALRTLDYLSFMVTGFIAGLWLPRPDVIVGTSPQFFTNCAAWMLSVFKWRPFVFELRDLWPESIKTVGAMKDSAALRLLERLELFLYRRATAVVAVTESFRRNLIARGIDGDKVHVVTNGVDLSRFRPMARDPQLAQRLGLTDQFVAGYIGTHGMAHALETVLEAAALMRARPQGVRVRFVLLGDGAQKQALKARAQRMGLDNVLFLDTVPKADVPRYWSLLDVAIIHLRKADNFTQVIPSKLFECMGVGIPVLHGVAGESAGIVEREGVGLVFEPENAQALCDGLLRLAQDQALYRQLRSHCLAAAPRYDRRGLAAKMLGVLTTVAGRG